MRKIIRHRFLAFLLLTFSLTSCAGFLIKAAYNNADWFMKNEVDKLFDITWRQDSILSQSLSVFLDYHRKKELPLIYDFMENVKQNNLKTLDLDTIYRTTNDFNVIRNRMFDALLDDGFTEFLASLEVEQVDFFVKESSRFTEPRIGDDGKSFRDRTDKENQERSLTRRKENVITWFGEITPEQVEILDSFPLFDRTSSEIQLLLRRDITQQIIEQLRKQVLGQSTPEESTELYRAMLTRPREFINESYLAVLDKRTSSIHQTLVEFHKTLTQPQKQYFTEQLEYYQSIVSDLMKSS